MKILPKLAAEIIAIAIGICFFVPRAVYAQIETTNSSLLFSKRVATCENPTFSKKYSFVAKPTYDGLATGALNCDFTISYNRGSGQAEILVDFNPIEAFVQKSDGSKTKMFMRPEMLKLTPGGKSSDRELPPDEKVLQWIRGVLFFDLKVSGPDEPILGYRIGSETDVLDAGVKFSRARVIETKGDLVQIEFQQSEASQPPPSAMEPAMTVLNQVFTGTATLNKETGLVESCDVSASCTVLGHHVSEAYSIKSP